MKVMEQRPNQSAGPGIFPDRCRAAGCAHVNAFTFGPVGFQNKCGQVGLGTNFIGSVSGRVYLFKKIIYARRVRVRSDSGGFRTREDLYSTVTFDQFNVCLLNESIHFFQKRKIS